MSRSEGRGIRLAATAVGTLLACAVAACGSPSTTSSGKPTPSATVSASPTSVTSTDPGDPTLLPVPQDIPFTQAPPDIQSEWRQYYATGAITVVPNSTVPYKRPPTPQVVNDTAGAVDQVTAQRWADAAMRETAWENWAISVDQVSLLDSGVISAPAVTAGVVLPTGASGFVITGSRWPSSLRLVPVHPDTQSFLKVSDSYALIATFATGWSVLAKYPDGHTQPVGGQSASPGATDAVTGTMRTVSNFGELWFGSQGFACDSNEPGQIVALCNE